MKASHRIRIATWAKLHQQGTMSEIELRSELTKLFQQTLEGQRCDAGRECRDVCDEKPQEAD